MCSKSGGSPPVPNATSTAFQSATAPSSFAMPYYQQYIQNAAQLSGTPFNPEMLGSVAPLNANQTDLGNVMYGMGLNLPTAVQNLQTAGANAGTFDPNAVTSIMSPFTQQVTQATQNWFNNQNSQQANDLMSNAIRSGNAFGGDRAGIAAAQLAGQQQLAQAPVIAGLQQAGYSQALNEYNTLKQMGLTGAQAGLQGSLAGISGAGAAEAYGNQLQQQQQRGLDVAQQNAMMASAYPFQIQNWYGSALGGMGPLLGSFSQGYTTPPPPNATTQITGAISALGGLGTSLFGSGQKYGGPVGRRMVGGLVRMRDGGLAVVPIAGLRRGPRPHYSGGLVRLRRGGFVPRFQGGGFLGDGTYVSGGGDEGDTTVSVAPQRKRPSFDLAGSGFGRLSLPQYRGGGGPPQADVSGMMSAAMKAANQKQPDNSLGTAITGIAGAAKAVAPLFAALERGGAVRARRFQDGGDADDDDSGGDDTTPVYAAPSGADAVPTPRARPPVGPVPSAETADLPAMSSPGAMAGEPSELQARVQRENPSVEDEAAAAEPAAPARAEPPARRGYQPIVAGPGGVRTVAGTEPRPRNYLERLAVNPLWNAGIAMLGSRSPYFGEGLAAGMRAATTSIEQQRAEKDKLLDQPGKIVDDGKELWVQHGNQFKRTGLSSPKARERKDNSLAAQRFADSQVTQQTKMIAPTLLQEPGWANKSPGEQLQEARRRAIEQWNNDHPDAPYGGGAAAPAAPAAPQRTAATEEPPPPMTVTGTSGPPPPTTAPATQTAAAPDQPFDVRVSASPEEKAREERLLGHEDATFKTPNTINPGLLEQWNTNADNFDFQAQQLAYGAPISGFVRGGSKVAQAYAQALRGRATQFLREQGWTAAQANGIMQQYAARTAGARVIGQMEARLSNAMNEAKATAPVVLDISARIPRTNYPMINDFVLAYRKNTGDPEVIRLGGAIETLINDYANTLGRGTGAMTDEARRRAGELLQRGYSHGQMGAAVDQMLIEIDRASESIRRGLGEYTGTTKAERYNAGDVLRPRGQPQTGGGGGPGGPTGAPAGGEHPDQVQGGVLYQWDAGAGKYKPIRRVQ